MSGCELLATKAVIDQDYPRNYVGTCAFFAKQVAHIHGPAQLEIKQFRGKTHGIYAIDSWSQHGRRGWGHLGNWGHGGGSSRGGCGGMSNSHIINGIDVSDPTHNFTSQEWTALGDSCDIVLNIHYCANGWGCGHHSNGHGRGHGQGNDDQNVSAVDTGDLQASDATQITSNTQTVCGAHNGHGFRHGAYNRDHA